MRNSKGQFTSESRGEANYKWKGDKVGYFGLHTWVQRTKGKAKICVDCGSSKNVHWANISKEYKREESDWKSLCQVCHWRFDGITKLSREQAKSIREKYALGFQQIALAKEFGVDQGTISNIIRHKIKFYG